MVKRIIYSYFIILTIPTLLSRMNSSFDGCKNLEDYEFQIFEHSTGVLKKQIKNTNDVDAPETAMQGHMFQFLPRLVHVNQPIFEISFQRNFMNEHTSAFKKQFQNYVEFGINACLAESLSPEERQLLVYSDGKNSNSTPAMKKVERGILSTESLDGFRPDGSFGGKLEQFLNFLSQHYSAKVVKELSHIANDVQLACKHFDIMEMQKKQLIEVAQQLVHQKACEYLKSTTIPCLRFMKGQFPGGSVKLEFQQRFTRFLNFYCSTVLLIQAQYFENPYFEGENIESMSSLDDCLKRQLSKSEDDEFFDFEDDEMEQCSCEPRKIQKR